MGGLERDLRAAALASALEMVTGFCHLRRSGFCYARCKGMVLCDAEGLAILDYADLPQAFKEGLADAR